MTVADKQGTRLKMHEMAILETLTFKNFWSLGVSPDLPKNSRRWRSYKHMWQAFGVLKLGVYGTTVFCNSH